MLLKAGADVKAADPKKEQHSLLIAACRGHDNYVRSLLWARVVRNVTGVDYQEGLKTAPRSNHEICLKLLLEAGADVNIITYGDHALTTAACQGHDKCLNLLLEAGADVNFCLRFGETALYSTVGRGDAASTSRLIQKGADVNLLNPRNSQSALSEAVYKNSIECIKLLLQAGGHVRMTNKDGLPNYVVHCLKQLNLHSGKNQVNREIIRLLQVAGEINRKEEINEGLIRVLGRPTSLDPGKIAERKIKKAREYLFDDETTLCFKDICRRAIREHLLQMSRVNLFIRVPHLGLPPSLARYLLYDVSLESQ